MHVDGLGKRYGKKWALQDSTFDLSRPTAGSALVEGLAPADEVDFLSEVGYLAQEIRSTSDGRLRTSCGCC